MARGMRALGQMAGRVANLIKGGIVERARFGEATQVTQVSMLSDDDIDDMSVYGDMGVAFRLNEGAEVVALEMLGGNSAMIGTNQRDVRPTETPGGGEVPEGAGGLHYLGAWRVYLDDAGRVFLGGATDTSEPVLLGDTAVTLYDAHVHPTPFGPSGAPTVSLATAKSTKLFGA